MAVKIYKPSKPDNMKKLLLLCILPFLFAFQCDEEINDDSYQTNLVIQNNSSFDLIFESVPNNISNLPSQQSFYMESQSSNEGFLLPSEFEFINNIRLYKRDAENNLILAYEQTPLQDSLWIINESTAKNVDHVLIITEDLLNE